jgi:hypothetical protein
MTEGEEGRGQAGLDSSFVEDSYQGLMTGRIFIQRSPRERDWYKYKYNDDNGTEIREEVHVSCCVGGGSCVFEFV